MSPPPAKRSFPTEADLVRSFVSGLGARNSPWGTLEIATEWDYRTGITDVLARNVRGELIAFEAKLTDWRRAVHQAYRNTTFAQKAYVVLPSAVAVKAAHAADVFGRYKVGLCSVDDACINVLIEAPHNEVLIPWLRARATTFFDDGSRNQQARASSTDRRTNLRSDRCVA